jgi:diketogulonate reductase-like aldo/keto reductase
MPRWHLQNGRAAIPKSTKPGRIAESFDIRGWESRWPQSSREMRPRPSNQRR